MASKENNRPSSEKFSEENRRTSKNQKGRGRGTTLQQSPTTLPSIGRGRGQPQFKEPCAEPYFESPKVDELVEEIKENLSMKTFQPGLIYAPRPGKGTLGRRFPVYANHFPLTIPRGYLYHYDVEIEAIKKEVPGDVAINSLKKLRPLSLKMNRLVIETLRKTNELFKNCYPAYDGNKNMITKNPLSINGEVTIIVDYEEEERRKDNTKKMSKFQVTIKPVHKKETKSCAISLDKIHCMYDKTVGADTQDSIMALETILRHCPSLRLVPVGRSLYMRPESSPLQEISGGLNVWTGYHQSIHLGENAVLLNIDRSTTTFYPPIQLIEFVFKILADNFRMDRNNFRSLQPNQISALSKELRNLKIFVKHLGYPRKYIIHSISKECARNIVFETKEQKISVEKYFDKTYKKSLQYPLMPCVNVGNSARPIYLPFEMCYIKEDQPYKRKLSAKQTSDIIRSTAIPPKQRFEEIYRKLQKMDMICDPVKKEFGIGIGKKPIMFQARELPPPFLVYHANKKAKPTQGVWDMKNREFFRPCVIEKWAIVSFSFPRFCGPQQLKYFADKLEEEARNYKISLGKPVDTVTVGRNDRIESLLQGLKSRHGPSLTLVVIVVREDTDYGGIKRAGDKILGLTTQCIKDVNVAKKCNSQLLGNLLQKINAKLGGINVTLSQEDKLDVLRRPVMIVGADVTHPAPGDFGRPSIAAVVASIDRFLFRYAVAVRVQAKLDRMHRRLEIIQDLKSMMVQLLNDFVTATRCKPESIIFFRDGVSEGQFEEVRDKEITMIRAACEEMSHNERYRPRLTFVVIQKRHHTRLMPANERDGVGKCGNVPPGTTVDTAIAHPYHFDFFQCSHFGIQGTSRPAKYTVLQDDSHFTADEMQRLTYYLCHTYARCTRAISMPSPVMYAHLAATRAKEHLSAANVLSDSDTFHSSSDKEKEVGDLSPEIMEAIKLFPQVQKSMYFV